MKEKKFPVEIGNFEEKKSGFFEYISDHKRVHGQEGRIHIRVQRKGYLSNKTIKKTVNSFLQSFYEYFSDDVTGRVSVYTVPSRAEEPSFYIESNENIIANLLWEYLGKEEDIIDTLSGIITPRIGEIDIPSVDRLEFIFRDGFYEKLEAAILARRLKES